MSEIRYDRGWFDAHIRYWGGVSDDMEQFAQRTDLQPKLRSFPHVMGGADDEGQRLRAALSRFDEAMTDELTTASDAMSAVESTLRRARQIYEEQEQEAEDLANNTDPEPESERHYFKPFGGQ